MFSYNEYKNIISIIKEHLPIVDFKNVSNNTLKFCILRHDIEFSIDRAYKLAKIEKEIGVSSTYTVQIRNNTYNALSEKNINLIKRLSKNLRKFKFIMHVSLSNNILYITKMNKIRNMIFV